MKKVFIVLLVVIALAVIVFFSTRGNSTAKGDEVYLEEVERRDVVATVSATGFIQPKTRVNISSNVMGEIIKLPVIEGQTVREGDLLVKIDPEIPENRLRQQETVLREYRTQLELAIVEQKSALRTLSRIKKLHEKALVSEDDLEQAQLGADRAAVGVRRAEDAVSRMESEVSIVKEELSKTVLHAPMDGVISQLNTEVGETAIMGTTNVPGSVLMTISDMSEILAEVKVDETEVVDTKLGQQSVVEVDAVKDYEYHGTVSSIGSTAVLDGEISVFLVELQLTDADAALRPGMSASAEIEKERRSDVIAIPIQAVREEEVDKDERSENDSDGKTKEQDGLEEAEDPDGNEIENTVESLEPELDSSAEETATEVQSEEPSSSGSNDDEEAEKIKFIFVIEDGKAVRRVVTTGISDDRYVEILSGVEEDERVITGPYKILRRLEEGDRVREKEDKSDEDGEGGEGAVRVEVD